LLLPAILLAAFAIGCSGNSAENMPEKQMPAGTGQALNPTGKLSPEEQKIADERKQAGDAAGRSMAAAAKAMQEAKAKSGG